MADVVDVQSILQLPEFASCRVVGGQQGLSRPVRWVHISDLPDVTFWLRGGEILIHSGAGHNVNLVHLVRQLYSVKGAALAVAEANDVMSNEACKTADELGLPLILIPDEVRFVDLTYAAMHTLMDKEFQESLELERFWHEVTRSAVYDVANTLQYVADWLQARVTLYDRSFTALLAKWPTQNQKPLVSTFPAVEDQFRAAIADSEGVSYCVDPPVWAFVVRNRTAIVSFATIHLLSERSVSTRRVTSAIQVIRVATTMFSQTQNLRLQMAGDTFRAILDEEGTDDELAEQCRIVGIDLLAPSRVVVLQPAGEQEFNFSFRQTEQVLRNFPNERLVARPQNDALVVLIPVPGSQGRDRYAALVKRMRELLAEQTGVRMWKAGIGGEVRGIIGIRKSRRQAQTALQQTRDVDLRWFEDVALWDVLVEQLRETMVKDTLDEFALPAQHRERERMVDTMQALVACSFNVSRAADVLSLHRNGLNRRLQRWHERYGIDFTNPQNVLAFSALLSISGDSK
ncbi:PucR family transcriptional regulator [Alicyclobacillus sp. ALC3]|uniref:PucR family transcriptional regulator n=1 Tax=Alicyclobacillus sp. ALC3 TaxID=2796143 RepID=UPI002379E7F4|nr:PucR family transcriptional regulator ligand-binding domain-containing protein [Alicyclobacillus sp. ALC3]WDL97768.1 PucR family transcriptional regulator ligand-binding domain-containing protein [Alicyclobacillus sp. ALC3]